MASVSYQSLFPFVSLDVRGVPEPVMAAMANLAARELCLQSSCWYEWSTISLVAGVNEYEVDAPSAMATVRAIKYLGIGTRSLKPDTESNILATNPQQLDQAGPPMSYFMLSDMRIRLLPTPTANEAGQVLRVKAAFIPTLAATELPAELIERFSETLIAGTKSRLMAMPGQAWTNPQLAQVYEAAFNVGVDSARIEVETSYSPTGLNVSRRSFGAKVM